MQLQLSLIVRIRTMELSRHTSQFAPLPVFSGRFRFAPFGTFYYWRKLVHTPVLYGADASRFTNFIDDRAPHQASENLPCPGLHRLRHVPLSHATRVSYPITEFSFFLLFAHATDAFFQAPPIFHSRMPNFYCLRSLAPLLFELTYFCRASSIRSRISIFAVFSTFCVFLRPRSPSICRLALINLGVNRHLSDGYCL